MPRPPTWPLLLENGRAANQARLTMTIEDLIYHRPHLARKAELTETPLLD